MYPNYVPHWIADVEVVPKDSTTFEKRNPATDQVIAQVAGTAAATVVLVNGVDASLHLIDLRNIHGVVVAAIAAEARIDLELVVASLAPVVPRKGRIDKDGSAVIRFADADICQILGFGPGELVGMRAKSRGGPA